MRVREVLNKRTIFVLAIILGLILFGIAIYVLKFKPNPERIWVEGEPVEIGSVSLYPEQSKVEATAWFEYGELYMDVTLVELDVNDTYCYLQISLNPHPETTVEASQTFGGYDRMSEGDVIHIHFLELGSNFKLRDGNRVDAVLPFYVSKEKIVERQSFWANHMYVGEIEFSVEVQGEIPSEYM